MALTVVLILVLGMIAIGNRVLLGGRHEARGRGARAMAEAGIEYGYWQVAYNNAALPYTASRSLGNGNFSVTVTDNSTNISQTYQITGTGTLNGETYQSTRVVQNKAAGGNVCDYALCSIGDISSNKVNTGSGGANGDIRSNGNIQLWSANASVNGDAYAGGSCSITTITGSSHANYASLTFPSVNLAYYQGIANRTFNGSVSWSGFTFLTANEVVYVNGDVNFNTGTISGTGTLVISGRFNFNGNLSYGLSTDRMAGISIQGANVNGSCSSLVGIYYCHDSSNDSTVILAPPLTVSRGSFTADKFIFNSGGGHQITILRDPGMNASVGQQLHLPGY